MRILVKILCFPLNIILKLLVSTGRIVGGISNMILSLLSIILLLIALGTVVLLQEPLFVGVRIVVLAWAVSPIGLPILFTLMVELIEDFRQRIIKKVY